MPVAVVPYATQVLGNLGSGVWDFFYEPATALLHSPKQLHLGIAKGTLSLLRNTLMGTAQVGSHTPEPSPGPGPGPPITLTPTLAPHHDPHTRVGWAPLCSAGDLARLRHALQGHRGALDGRRVHAPPRRDAPRYRQQGV